MNDDEHHKSPAESLLSKLGAALVGTLATAALFLVMELGRPLLDAVVQASTKDFLVRLVALLGFVLLIALAYILYLRSQIRKPLSSKFDFDEFGGYYIDRKTKHYVCARCLADGVVVHMMEIGGVMRCNACTRTYRKRPTPNVQ
jgi:hypothetical protein